MIAAKTLYTLAGAATAALGTVAPPLVPEMEPVERVMRAIGVSIDWTELVAGLCFAIAGGFVAMAISPPERRLTKWATLAVALLVGLIVAVLHPQIPVASALPVQAVMGIGGLSSRPLASRAVDMDFSLPWGGKS